MPQSTAPSGSCLPAVHGVHLPDGTNSNELAERAAIHDDTEVESQDPWTSDPLGNEISVTPEQWDDGVMEQIGTSLVLHQTQSLCLSQAQTDVRVQILQA